MDLATFCATYVPIGVWPEGIMERFASEFPHDPPIELTADQWAALFASWAEKARLADVQRTLDARRREWDEEAAAEERRRAEQYARYQTPEAQQLRAERRSTRATQEAHALVLRKEGKTYAAIAEALGISLNSAQRRVYGAENRERRTQAG